MAIQSPSTLTVGSLNVESSSTRKLRTRARRSYVLPDLTIDDLDSFSKSNRNLPTEKKLNSSVSIAIPHEGQPNPSTLSASNDSSKPTGRLLISHQHRVATPPPLPSCSLSYLQSDKFPAWLLGDVLVKSSPNYLSQQTQSSGRLCSEVSRQNSPMPPAVVSFLPNSPSKIRSSLDRHPSTSSLRLARHSIHRSTSPDEELETRREQFWECYEYDTTAPHLQPRYFDKPLPSGEQWSDLDIQNIGVLPAPIDASPTIHLFEVFAPSVIDSASDEAPDDKSSDQEVSSQKISAMPFGFHFLPPDYDGHQNQGIK